MASVEASKKKNLMLVHCEFKSTYFSDGIQYAANEIILPWKMEIVNDCISQNEV